MADKIEVVDASTPGVGDGGTEVHQVSVGTWAPKDGDGQPRAVVLRISAGAHHATARIADQDLLDDIIEALESNGAQVFRAEELAEEARRNAEFNAMSPEQVNAILFDHGYDPKEIEHTSRFVHGLADMHNTIARQASEIEGLRARLDAARVAGVALVAYVAGARSVLSSDPEDGRARGIVQAFGPTADLFDGAMLVNEAEFESRAAAIWRALTDVLPFADHTDACSRHPCDCGKREAVHAAEEALA